MESAKRRSDSLSQQGLRPTLPIMWPVSSTTRCYISRCRQNFRKGTLGRLTLHHSSSTLGVDRLINPPVPASRSFALFANGRVAGIIRVQEGKSPEEAAVESHPSKNEGWGTPHLYLVEGQSGERVFYDRWKRGPRDHTRGPALWKVRRKLF